MRINASFQVSPWLTQSRLNQAATNLPQPALLTLALARPNGLRQLATSPAQHHFGNVMLRSSRD